MAPIFKTTNLLCYAEPDLTITVGNQVFKEYSTNLCCWSGFFDAAMKSGMKETQTKSFDFPDRNPEEWQWIMSLMEPMATEQVTKDNLTVALSWFDELSSEKGLQKCDRVLCDDIISVLLPEHETSPVLVAYTMDRAERSRPSLEKVLNCLATSIQYSLKRSKDKCLEILNRCIKDSPLIFQLSPEQTTRLVSFVASNEECMSSLWPSLEEYLPSENSTKDEIDAMVKNSLFPSLLSQGMQVKTAKLLTGTVLGKVANCIGRNNNYPYLRNFVNPKLRGADIEWFLENF